MVSKKEKIYRVCFSGRNKFSGNNEFLYMHTDTLEPGDLVLCPFGNRKILGTVLGVSNEKPKFEIKNIDSKKTSKFLNKNRVALFEWLRKYYKSDPGPALDLFYSQSTSTRHLENKDVKWLADKIDEMSAAYNDRNKKFKLNKLDLVQQKVLKRISDSKKTSFLLHGATGSGKTEIYLHQAILTLGAGKSVIILVPEIGLTSQNMGRFQELGYPLIIVHSKQTVVQRSKNWQLIKKMTELDMPIVVLGPRSALFAPIANLGLVVIDEFHDESYKQDAQPKYNTLFVAGKLCGLESAKLILGSATPNIADYYTLDKLEVEILELDKRDGQNKVVTVLDGRDKDQFSKSRIFTDTLINSIGSNLAQNKQALIFHNRRGSSRMQICSKCDWINSCPNCLIPLVFHADEFKIRCHTCGFNRRPETSCPDCGSVAIDLRGFGTKQLVDELQKLFANAKVVRFDADNTKKSESLRERFSELESGNGIDIIVGTQMLAKGLDLPNLGLVGLVQADSGLSMPDFRSAERVFQLVTQVIGRVGRGHGDGEVVIQTFTPEHYAIKLGSEENYRKFYTKELEDRQAGLFPPFVYQMKINFRYASEYAATNAGVAFISKLKEGLEGPLPHILGPYPAFRQKIGGKFNYQIVIKSPKRYVLEKVVDDFLPTNWTFDLDPTSLL